MRKRELETKAEARAAEKAATKAAVMETAARTAMSAAPRAAVMMVRWHGGKSALKEQREEKKREVVSRERGGKKG